MAHKNLGQTHPVICIETVNGEYNQPNKWVELERNLKLTISDINLTEL